ncbi:MAG: hypothetical protein R3331_11205 [Sulfurospirillaceae bacterium]|nr:hypothetical protein [Sulfurospirillaceae bacterium]
MKSTQPNWPEELVVEIENIYLKKCEKYANTADAEVQDELHHLRASVVDGFAEKYPEVSFYHDQIIARIDLSQRYPGKLITKITSRKEALQMAKCFGRKEISLIQTIFGIISFSIIYGGGFLFLIYAILNIN